jgi:hypothetical protein
VLDTDINSLLHVAIAYFLVDYDANRGTVDIVDDAGLAMVDFVGHAFLDGTVGFNIDDITDSVEMISSYFQFSGF